jgi:hypothetical protein
MAARPATSPDSITQIAALRIEPTYSAREAALLLGRSFSWLDKRLRAGQFMLPDGTTVQPRRTPGGYRCSKAKALARTRPPTCRAGRYLPPDDIITWLEAL